MKIKTGDKVKVLAGKDRGKEGKILQVFPKISRVVVDGINMMTRHLRGGGDRPGQKIQFPGTMHVSNVQLISAKSGKKGRVGYKFIEKDGQKTKIRVIRKGGSAEDAE
jgi:large subunit ribosomal protein L24